MLFFYVILWKNIKKKKLKFSDILIKKKYIIWNNFYFIDLNIYFFKNNKINIEIRNLTNLKICNFLKSLKNWK